jgi:hypothetical protein
LNRRFRENREYGMVGEVNRESFMKKFAAIAAVATALCFSAAYAMAEQGTKEEQEACTPDVYKFCSSNIPDEKRIVNCLKTNMKKLSPACRMVFSGS